MGRGAGAGAAGFGAITDFSAGFGLAAALALRAGAFRGADFFFADFFAVLRGAFRAVLRAARAVLRPVLRAARAVLRPVLRAVRAVLRAPRFAAFLAFVLRELVFFAVARRAPALLAFFLLVVRFFPLFLIAMACRSASAECRTRPSSDAVRRMLHWVQTCRLTSRVNSLIHYTMIASESGNLGARSQ